MTSAYYTILTEVSQRLSKDDLSNMIFSCGDILPPSSAEKISTGIHLFRELKQRGHLGPANYDYLRKQLVVVGRHDLSSMLPDQFEIFFGRSSVQNMGHFGCIVNPTAPDTFSSMISASSLKYIHADMESRMFVLQLSQQLNSEDSKKLAFLMYPTHSQLTALEVAELLEKEGGLHSISVINRLSGCLEAIGRVDLAQQLSLLKIPQVLNLLSTSQQQLNLKMSLLLHSKQQSFDFYMRTLTEFECNSEVRTKLLGRLCVHIRGYFSNSNITLLTQNLQQVFKGCITSIHGIELDSLLNNTLLEGLKVNQVYCMRTILMKCKEIPVETLWKLNEQVHDSYNSFDSLMDILNWNSVVRRELKMNVDLHRTPYGTPAELACKYIVELFQEVSGGCKIFQEKQMTDRYIQTFNSNYYCACYHIIILQWLASLLCYLTSFGLAQIIDLSKFKETLWYILQQKRDEIMQSYTHLADIVGPDILHKLIPLPESTDSVICQLPLNPSTLFFNVLIIKLLAAASLGHNQTPTEYLLIDSDQAAFSGSRIIMVSAAAMKKQINTFREKLLSEDPLCSHVIAALTVNSHSYMN